MFWVSIDHKMALSTVFCHIGVVLCVWTIFFFFFFLERDLVFKGIMFTSPMYILIFCYMDRNIPNRNNAMNERF